MIRDLSVASKSLPGRLACPDVMQPPERRWIVKPVLHVREPQAKRAAGVLRREMENQRDEQPAAHQTVTRGDLVRIGCQTGGLLALECRRDWYALLAITCVLYDLTNLCQEYHLHF